MARPRRADGFVGAQRRAAEPSRKSQSMMAPPSSEESRPVGSGVGSGVGAGVGGGKARTPLGIRGTSTATGFGAVSAPDRGGTTLAAGGTGVGTTSRTAGRGGGVGSGATAGGNAGAGGSAGAGGNGRGPRAGVARRPPRASERAAAGVEASRARRAMPRPVGSPRRPPPRARRPLPARASGRHALPGLSPDPGVSRWRMG
jgi:hypothetical protein